MASAPTAQSFHGIDWHTNHAALAKLLGTLDAMQTLLLGFGEAELPEQEQLRVLADLAAEARVELDFVAADQLVRYGTSARHYALMGGPALQATWSIVEADELVQALFALAHEARAAMRHQRMSHMPETVTLDLSDLLRRVKLLLTSLDDAPARLLLATA